MGGPVKEAVCRCLGWKPNMYQKGLQALQEAGAIRRQSRGFYQINPHYAGRGWGYDRQLGRGGVEALMASFSPANSM